MAEDNASVRALQSHGSGLGLAAGEVAVVGHNPAWGGLFSALAADLMAVLPRDAAVEHVGSTSVPGLAAKPILDVAIGMAEPIDEPSLVDSLTALGLKFVTDLGIYGGRLFTAENESGEVVCNIHVVDVNDFQWRWYLAFRDGLRSDPALRSEYEALKRTIVQSNGSERETYNKAKFDWVLATVDRLDKATGTSTTSCIQ